MVFSRSSVLPVQLTQHSLPPRFRLYAIRKPVGSVLKRNSTDKSPKPIRPIRVGQKHPQYRPAEKLAARSDLRRDGEFAQPTVELRICHFASSQNRRYGQTLPRTPATNAW